MILVGKTCSGKTKTAKALEDRGYKRIVTYTTRPMRPGEIDGVDYNFITPETFLELKEKGFFAETASYDAAFGHCYYGSSKSSYQPDSVIVLNPYGVKQLKDQGISDTIVYLNVPDELIKKRARHRGDALNEVWRRLEADRKDFAGMEDIADIIIDVTEDMTISDVAEKVLDEVRELKIAGEQDLDDDIER